MTPPTNDIIPQGYKMTEIGVLPEEWEVVKFDSCINKQNSKEEKIKKQEYKIYGRYPVIDQGQDLIAGYWDNEKDVYKKNLPVIIFGDHTRIIKYIDFPFVTGADGTKILVPNPSVVFPRFFYYSLLNLKIPSRGYNRHYSLLRESKIPLPPLLEQQKIAAVLSAVQEAKEKTEAVIAAAKALKKSMMKHLFTYGPVSPQEAETVPLKETEIGPVPENWEVTRVGEVLENKNIKFKNLENNFKDTPILSMTREFGLIRQEHKFDKRVASKDLSNYKIVEKGNVVVGFPIDEGVISILFNSDYGVVSPTYEIWQLKSKNIDLYFFDTLLRYELMMNQYLKYMTRGVERRRIIKKNDFTGLFVPLPPLPTQQKIASILSAIDAKIEAEENKKKALEELFKSLLHNLMTAKIRVNQLEVTS